MEIKEYVEKYFSEYVTDKGGASHNYSSIDGFVRQIESAKVKGVAGDIQVFYMVYKGPPIINRNNIAEASVAIKRAWVDSKLKNPPKFYEQHQDT